MRSDTDLVNAVLSGRRDHYTELVNRYERAALATATAVLRDCHSAEDAAQEAFVIAYLQLAKLRKPKAFGGWLLKIVRNEAIRIARRQRNVELLDETSAEQVSDRNDQLDEQSTAVVDAVMRLPERQRIPVMLKYFDGLSVSQIAQMTDSPVGTVTVRLSRARKRLRRWLGEVRS